MEALFNMLLEQGIDWNHSFSKPRSLEKVDITLVRVDIALERIDHSGNGWYHTKLG